MTKSKPIRRARYSACLALLAILAPAGAISASAAPPANPTAMVKSAIDRTIEVFKDNQIAEADRQHKLRAIAEENFDFGAMARSAVGYHWRDFSPAQRDEFVPLFTSFIEDVYLDQIRSYSVEKVNQQMKSSVIDFVKEQRPAPEEAEVFSTVALHDRDHPLQVNYLMTDGGDGWKIYDLTIDSISVIANYRNQFNRVLNDGGYSKLVTIMREKAAAISARLSN